MLNIVMNEGVKTICQKGIETGTLTLKLKIQMNENDSEDTPQTSTYIPLIDYKIGFNYQEKLEESGLVGGADIQITTEDGTCFIVRSDPNGQLEMDLD